MHTPNFSASYLGLICLSMSYLLDVSHCWVNFYLSNESLSKNCLRMARPADPDQ